MPRRRKRRPGAVKKPSRRDLRGRADHQLPAVSAPSTVNQQISLALHHRTYYHQGESLQCVAFSSDQSITLRTGRTYNPGWLFYRAQAIDGIPGEIGTTTDAVCRVLRDLGNVLYSATYAPQTDDPSATVNSAHGIERFDWLSTSPDEALDQARHLISIRQPFVFPSPWYKSFGEHHHYWNGTYVEPLGDWGPSDDIWHQYLIDGAFDDGEFLTTPNSWGWPASDRMSYASFKRLVAEGGHAAALFMAGSPSPLPQPPAPTPSPTPDPFTCPVCGKTFKNKKRLKRHQRRKH